MALKDILDIPPKRSENYVKVAALIYEGAHAIGYADLHVHYRTDRTAYVGLFILREDVQGKGHGRKAFHLVEAYLVQTFGIEKMCLGVSDQNQVLGYWEKMGFVPNGFTYQWQGEKMESTVTEMEKTLS